MLTRKHIIPVSAGNRSPYSQKLPDGTLDKLSPEELISLIDFVLEELDSKKDIKIDDVFTSVLIYPQMNDEVRIRILELGLKATNFVQKWFCSLLKKRFHEKYGLKVSRNLYFGIELNHNMVNTLIGFAKSLLWSKNGDVVLKAHCMLESFGIEGRREGSTLFFVSYVFAESKVQQILLEWSRSLGMCRVRSKDELSRLTENIGVCDKKGNQDRTSSDTESHGKFLESDKENTLQAYMGLEILFLPDMPLSDFFVQELRYISDYQVIEQVLVNLGSHRTIDRLFPKIFAVTRSLEAGLDDLLVKTLSTKELLYTKSIIEKIFCIDPAYAEKILKNIIVKARFTGLCSFFYEKCQIIDSSFVESCIICKSGIKNLYRQVDKIVESHYLVFLTKDYDVFEEFVLLLEKMSFSIELFVHSFFRDERVIDKQVLKKLWFFSTRFEATRRPVLGILASALDNFRLSSDNKTLYVYDKKGTKMLLPLCNESVSYLFSIVRSLKKFPEIEKFCEVFIFINSKFFLESIFSDEHVALDTYFIRTLSEICNHRHHFPHLYQEACKRLRLMCLLYTDNYWSTAIRKEIRMNFGDLFDKNKKELPEVVEDSKTCKMMATSNLVRYFLQKNDTEVRRKIQDVLNERERYREGLVFNRSLLSIKTETKKFCIYGIFYQYEDTGSCNLFSLISPLNEEISLGIRDKRYFIKSYQSPNAEVELLESTESKSAKGAVAIEVSGKKGTFYYGAGKSVFRVGSVAKVLVGDGFNGILSRILFHDTFSYSRRFLSDVDRAYYFLYILKNLEKKLSYSEGAGVYVDTLKPYYLTNKKLSVEMFNVIQNRNLDWGENDLVQKAIRNGNEAVKTSGLL